MPQLNFAKPIIFSMRNFEAHERNSAEVFVMAIQCFNLGRRADERDLTTKYENMLI